jgi:hypothetical protein
MAQEKLKVTLGDLVPCPKGTPNPYLVPSLMTGLDEHCRTALGRFLRGKKVEGFDIWYAPCCGGAKKLTSVEDIDIDQDYIEFYYDEEGNMRPR